VRDRSSPHPRRRTERPEIRRGRVRHPGGSPKPERGYPLIIVKEALERLDALMNRLVEADQTGSGIDPLRVAGELGQIRQLLAEAPAVVRAKGGQKHFRCEACGTISHGERQPERCPTCGGRKFFAADIEQPFVESGAG
jgi:hypothetical protein